MIDLNQALRLVYLRLQNWTKLGISHLPDLFVAIVVIFLAYTIAGYVRQILSKSLTRVSHNPALVDLTSLVASTAIKALGFFVALGTLGLDKTVTSLLAGAGVVALAIGFAFQDLTANFISGTMIAIQRPIQVGDMVETNGFQGRVVAVKLRSVVLDNFAGQKIEIPSKDVFQKPIVNYTRTGQRRLELSAGISYLDDLDKAQQVAKEAISALPFVLKDKPVDLFYKAFAGDSIQFKLLFWLDHTDTNTTFAMSEVIKTLKRAFDEEGILLMFPIGTYDLKKRIADDRNPPAQDGQV
nr:mechanosensitive ion channel family protein [uncultured Arsenicibacter sp.]